MFDTLIRDDALVFVRGTLLVFLKRDVPNITKKKMYQSKPTMICTNEGN